MGSVIVHDTFSIVFVAFWTVTVDFHAAVPGSGEGGFSWGQLNVPTMDS